MKRFIESVIRFIFRVIIKLHLGKMNVGLNRESKEVYFNLVLPTNLPLFPNTKVFRIEMCIIRLAWPPLYRDNCLWDGGIISSRLLEEVLQKRNPS